jgi:hypothetical protein
VGIHRRESYDEVVDIFFINGDCFALVVFGEFITVVTAVTINEFIGLTIIYAILKDLFNALFVKFGEKVCFQDIGIDIAVYVDNVVVVGMSCYQSSVRECGLVEFSNFGGYIF